MLSFPNIDRHAEIREAATQTQQFFESADSRVLLWYKGKLLVREKQSLYFRFDELKPLGEQVSSPIYLGRHQKRAYFACHIQDWHPQFDSDRLFDLRSASRFTQDFHLGLLFYSQGLLNWHHNHPFCAKCGARTEICKSGHARQCVNPDCMREHFPRIEPAVIFSVVNKSATEQKILLARQSSWDENRYSVIAGFIEPGESLEDGVRREALEETALTVNNLEYVCSQPWPFPGSLMIGYTCETLDTSVTLLDQELEEAHWFSAEQIVQSIAQGRLKLPFRLSISWHLINRWFKSQTGRSLDEIK